MSSDNNQDLPAADRRTEQSAKGGVALRPEIRERIFDPFFTTKPVGEGTGLGLDISWRIVANKHNGDLRFHSAPGDTRFQVRLPLASADPRPPQEPS